MKEENTLRKYIKILSTDFSVNDVQYNFETHADHCVHLKTYHTGTFIHTKRRLHIYTFIDDMEEFPLYHVAFA